jgi:transposase
MTIRNYDQYQCYFKVVNPLDNIPDNHPCFIIDAVVESLDFDEFESSYGDSMGMPIYHRKMLLKIDLMGTIDGILSSRKICARLGYDDVYKFLAGGHKPDFRTLCISRHENAEKFEEALLKINIIGRTMGIVTLNHISNDGSYFKGNASTNKLFTEKDMEIIDELIEQRYNVDRDENLLYGDKNYGIVEEDFYNTIQELINGDIVENTMELIKKDKSDKEVEKKVIKTVEKKIKKPKLKRISKKNKNVAKKAIEGDKSTLKKIKTVKKNLKKNGRTK